MHNWYQNLPEYRLHIGSNDITKTSYDNVNAEDLAHRILNNVINKKIKAYTLNYNPAKLHGFSTICTIGTKICLSIYYILVPMTLLKQVTIMSMQKILLNEF